MDILLKRQKLTINSTIGELSIGGIHECYTLEPPIRPVKPCAIPAGRYQVTVRWSMHFAKDLPHLENVPGFEGILIHTGNQARDTQGCIVVGCEVGPLTDWVSHSLKAFDALLEKIKLALRMNEKVHIWVEDAAVPQASV